MGMTRHSRDDDRQRQEKYHADVHYEVWRSGRHPDSVRYDDINDHFWRGDSAESAASDEIARMRRVEERRREEREAQEHDYYEQAEHERQMQNAYIESECAHYGHKPYGRDEGGVRHRCYCGSKRYSPGAARYWARRSARLSPPPRNVGEED